MLHITRTGFGPQAILKEFLTNATKPISLHFLNTMLTENINVHILNININLYINIRALDH